MANQQNSYTGSQGTGSNNADFSFTFPSFTTSEVKVEVDNVVKTLTTHYTVENYNTTSGGTVRFTTNNIPTGTTPVRIFRQTDVDAAKAEFTAGASLKAGELNDNFKQVRHALQEAIGSNATDRKIQPFNIEDQAVTTATIADDGVTTIKIADDNVTMAKLGSGALPTDITVASANLVDGTIVNADVNASAAIEGSKLQASSGSVAGTMSAANFTKLAGIETAATADQTNTEIRQLVESASDSNVFTNADHTKLNGIEDGATADQTNAEIKTAYEANADTNEFSDAEQSKLAGIEASATADQTASEIKTLLQSSKLELSEMNTTSLDSRYFTETECEAAFLRQDSTETIASGTTWSGTDSKVATTAAIDARIVDLIDDVGGFVPIANETSFPNANPDVNNGAGTLVSIKALANNIVSNGSGVATISNGTVGNSTVTINGLANSTTYTSSFGMIVETTTTLNTYTFHRLVPKATEVSTVSTNITNIVAAGANVADINNFADLYIINSSQPTTRNDGSSLTEGDLWYDSSNDNLQVYTGSAFSIITPSQSVLDDVAIVSGAVTYQEDLGLITNAASTGSSNGSLDIVADALEDEVTFTITAATGKFIVDGVDKPALTLYKGWTYTFDLSDASNATHPLRFSSGGSAYNTGVTVTGTQGQAGAKVQLVVPESQPTSFAYYCTAHSGMGNTITVKDDPIKTVADDIVKIKAVADNSTNINAVNSNATNINTVASSESNINRYADEYAIQSSAPSSPSEGDLWYNSTANTLNYYNSSAWVAISPGIAGVINDANPQLANHLDCNDKNLTEVGTISGNNLQIDFGSIA